ncbi:unnamed protein product [Rotaria magnacalcarata]|uniref:Uncharacterized protein n=6 Tax=Rotaria magnacalcarata TaxID=392030 RepID=A0A816KXQ8_9BILA|nr:unnamed protein product [Rotaria magnacalcarata]
MDLFQLNELTDDTVNLCNNDFYNFLENSLNKDLCELFRVQAIRHMTSLSSITIDRIIEILTLDIGDLNNLKKSLGFVTSDGKFHLRLGHRNLLERLLLLVKSKKNSSIKNSDLSNQCMKEQIHEKCLEMWRKASNSSNVTYIPVLFSWINSIFQNLQKTKNKYRYDNQIQEFALLIFILGGRNCYEFLRLNLPSALPHITNLELLIRNQEFKVIECEFRFNLLKEYSRSTNCNYIFVAEDATRSISCIDYDVQSNSFIGFLAPLVNGVPQSNFFRTEKFNVLKEWFDEADTSKFINLHMAKSLKSSAPPFILCAYGSNNKFEAIDVLRRWLYIYHESLIQGLRVIGFSTDGDSRYLRAMRLCSRFFAELPNLNLFKYNDQLDIKIPDKWSWFFMKQQQIFFFMQDPIHIATKIRNRLLSKLANLKMGDFSIDMKDLVELIEAKSKIEHNLIKSDLNPKDRQNFASCLRISSELVLDLLNRNENAKVIKKRLPIDALNTFGFNSQICENTLRIARSLSGAFSSITNFSVKSFMKRCEKISIVNSIKSRGSQTGQYSFQFPQHHKNDKEAYDYSINNIKELNLTENDIEKIINRAFESAKHYVAMVNMTQLLKSKNIYSLPELSQFIKTILSKSSSKIVDYTEDDDSNYDSDDDEFEDDDDGLAAFDDEDQMLSNTFDEDEEEEEDNITANYFSNVSRQNFKGCRIFDKIDPQQINKYFRISVDSSVKYIHKQSACWLLSTSKNRLSSDRLERVKE